MTDMLLIEDNPHLQTLYRLELTEKGHSLRIAPTLSHAKRELREHLPGLVLLDLHLPDSDGLDTLNEVLDAVPQHVPIIVNSAYNRHYQTTPKDRRIVYVLKSSDLTNLHRAVAVLAGKHTPPPVRPDHPLPNTPPRFPRQFA